MNVRKMSRDCYAVDDAETALVQREKASVGSGFIWRCYGCDKHPVSCSHIEAVREFRRQAYIEDCE